MLKDALNFFIEILFPPVCGKCGKLDKNWICDKCYRTLSRLKIINNTDIVNLHKLKNKVNGNIEKFFVEKFIKEKIINYDKFFFIFQYEGIIRKLIIDYKFNQKAYLSNLFATIILKDNKICNEIEKYDILIPVPMSSKKKKQRGYNQTELIVEKICKKLNINLEINCLAKIKNTKVQSTLPAVDRKENIKNAFIVNNKDKIKDKKIIVFDDIFTTGETANEISKVLKQAGAKEIFILVLAKD